MNQSALNSRPGDDSGKNCDVYALGLEAARHIIDANAAGLATPMAAELRFGIARPQLQSALEQAWQRLETARTVRVELSVDAASGQSPKRSSRCESASSPAPFPRPMPRPCSRPSRPPG